MKIKIVYVCDNCGKESKDEVDIIICEAQHLGLTTIQKRDYDKLVDEAKWCSLREVRNRNEQTIEATEKAIRDVIDFEQKHGINGVSY